MAETANLKLPLLAGAQAQKHVTVNEALARLDALASLELVSITETVPPAAPAEGAAWGVPEGAVNAWDGQAGQVAIFANGGWVFVAPRAGWRAWIADQGRHALFDGSDWQPAAVAVSAGGAATLMRAVEFDHVLAAGPSSTTAAVIPAGAQVIGVTGRILTAFTGTLTAWDLGVAGATNRYGNGLGLAAGSWVRGLSGSPVTYWSDTPLVLTAQGGDFAGGEIRLVLHLVELVPPG